MFSRIILIWLAMLLFMASCQKDDKINSIGRGIVINGLVTTDSKFAINISKSMYIGDTLLLHKQMNTRGAIVIVYENSLLKDTLEFEFDTFVSHQNFLTIPANYYTTSMYSLPGKEYTIHAKIEGFPDANAVTTIPDMVNIEKMDTTLVTLKGPLEDWECDKHLVCNIEFMDPVNIENYYLLYVFRSIDNNGSNIIPLTCNDPVIEEYLNHGTIKFGVAFSDKTINGKKYRLNITLDGSDIGRPFWGEDPPFFPHHKTTLYIRMYSITEEYFKYIQTLNLFLKNYKNPLAEPTQVYSNIEGGYGIFAGAAVSSDSLVFNY